MLGTNRSYIPITLEFMSQLSKILALQITEEAYALEKILLKHMFFRLIFMMGLGWNMEGRHKPPISEHTFPDDANLGKFRKPWIKGWLKFSHAIMFGYLAFGAMIAILHHDQKGPFGMELAQLTPEELKFKLEVQECSSELTRKGLPLQFEAGVSVANILMGRNFFDDGLKFTGIAGREPYDRTQLPIR